MIEYFRNGGFTRWWLLAAAVGTVGIAVYRKKDARSRVLSCGAFACVVLGMMGMAMGMVAVSNGVHRIEGDKGLLVAQGLGELSNNGSFGAILATLLGIASLVTRKPAQTV